ncbi:MAG: phosphoenolpyruvate synthase [Bacteroidia bacterium]|nr:phosphoenolpyruvate synthase [Bacteroidia bacterium]
MTPFILNFDQINIKDVSQVGGKNASLGEMFQRLESSGIKVPDGFAVSATAYRKFIADNALEQSIRDVLNNLNRMDYSNLQDIGKQIRLLIANGELSPDLQTSIISAYAALMDRIGIDCSLAVRSSATAEDLPEASFAGQQESYLNIKGNKALLKACRDCYVSLFTDRAIKYREDMGFDHMEVALSIGVQQMVRSDKACAGVGFTIDPDSGYDQVVVLSSSWGLGENVVKGRVQPDEFIVFKPTLNQPFNSVISKRLGSKKEMLIYSVEGSGRSTTNMETPVDRQRQFTLSKEEIEQLAKWAVIIEEHYQRPMDIEWAKDGLDQQLYIVQARPETIYSQKKGAFFTHYQLKEKGKVLTTGSGLGNKIAAGKARILRSPNEAHLLQKGEILVTESTDPDWDPILKKAAAVVTDKGGRTSHAAIVARELGAVAVVGAGDATRMINDGQQVTVSSAEGKTGVVYDGLLQWDEKAIQLDEIPETRTETMLILGDPDRAFQYAMLPNDGIGLMRVEFVISNAIRTHPMALVHFEQLRDEEARKEIETLTYGYDSKPAYFIDKFAQAVATIAAAFYPKDVIVRMSDFKSNEYANLLGGRQFEPSEENPMLGFRGASRYYHERYREGFRLECEAMKVVRDEMGLTNVKLMIPFCRTVEEGQKVVKLMKDYGLIQGENGLEIYTMIEIPSNVVLADQFAEVFDGFSIGSNDLTQLTLGLDRDNALISDLFDENNQAVKDLIISVIQTAKKHHIKIGLCGQAPSDFPEFAQFLVEQGIDSISFNADALWQGIENIHKAESRIAHLK